MKRLLIIIPLLVLLTSVVGCAGEDRGGWTAAFDHGLTLYDRGSYTEAAEAFTKAANEGSSLGQVWLGLQYEEGQGVPKDFNKAASLYRQAADQGDGLAQLKLGELYWRGQGVPQDPVQAVFWIRKAANGGFSIAQYNLGMRYSAGVGVPEDSDQAVFWIRKAADQRDQDAMFELGTRYEVGRGVPQDLVEAYKWYDLTAASFMGISAASHAKAIDYRDAVANKMTQAQIAQAQKRVSEWRPVQRR